MPVVLQIFLFSLTYLGMGVTTFLYIAQSDRKDTAAGSDRGRCGTSAGKGIPLGFNGALLLTAVWPLTLITLVLVYLYLSLEKLYDKIVDGLWL